MARGVCPAELEASHGGVPPSSPRHTLQMKLEGFIGEYL
jgi:hypothetical protein